MVLSSTCGVVSFSFLVKVSSVEVISFLVESSEVVPVAVVEVSVISSDGLSSSSGVLVSTAPLTILMSASQCF